MAAKAQSVRKSQWKATEVYEAEVETLTILNKDHILTEDLT